MNDVAIAAPVARVAGGLVRGSVVDGVSRFLAIPYAASPEGALRFRAPTPYPGWDGERDATTPGSSAPQHNPAARRMPGVDISPLFASGWTTGADFLTVNVWTSQTTGAGAPVMVFIHGGAFVIGGKDAPIYDGTAFARAGVVLMSINYRMGLEGFTHIPGADSNLGLRDALAALAWAKANAAAFGGDGDNVTVFGESAGAMMIADLVTSPLARGLFKRAIIQSGHAAMVRPIAVAQRVTRWLARRLKVSADIAGFSSRSIADGLTAVEWALRPTSRLDLRDETGREPTFGLSKFLPVWGDEVLPAAPLEALQGGAGADVDVLIGTNAEEMNLYLVPTGVKARIGGLMARFMLGRVLPRAGAVLREYGLGGNGRKAGDVFVQAMSDLVFGWPARRFAETHWGRTHVYRFGWRSPACGGALGACHGLELPFVFNTLASASGPEGLVGVDPPQDLADRIAKIWVDFARDGTLPWPQYRREDRQVYALEAGVGAPEPVPPAAKYLP